MLGTGNVTESLPLKSLTKSGGIFKYYGCKGLHAEYIMRNAGLGEAQAGIKIAGRNINNLRYADDTTLMAESDPSSTRLEALVPSRDSRARTRSPSPRAWRPDFPGAAREAP